MNSVIKVNSSIHILVALSAVVAAGFTVWACADLDMIYAAVGTITLFLVLSPLLAVKEYDLFCPWSFVILPVATLCTPKAICMSIGWPSPEIIDDRMLLGQEAEYFLYPSAIFLTAIICLMLGYWKLGTDEPLGITLNRKYSRNNTYIGLGLCCLVAFLATFAFVRSTGGVESGRLSAKRTKIRTIDVASDSELQQYGHFMQLAKMAPIAFLIGFSFFLNRNSKLAPWQVAALFLVFLLACAYPFYSSSRIKVVWVLINGLGVCWYFSREKFWSRLAVGATVCLILFFGMSFIRQKGVEDAMENASFSSAIERLTLDRNGPGIAKTSHIINHVPSALPFQNGKTIAVWAIAPVPRALFPGKPLIQSGPIIGRTIYGNNISGVPPGIIAELYWNFHIPGVIFGTLLFGFALRKIYGTFKCGAILPEIAVPVYLFTVSEIGFSVLGNSIGYGAFMKLIDFVTIMIVVWVCTVPLHRDE